MKNKDFRHTSGPLEDRFFYGRKAELEMIHNYIDIRQHFALIGQRQYGKTALIHKAIEKYKDKPLKAHIDLSRKSSIGEAARILIESFMEENFGMKKFFMFLLTDLTGTLKKVLSAPSLLVSKIKLNDYEVELRDLHGAVTNEGDGIDLFAKAIEFIDEVAYRNNKQVVLFIDEFQRLKIMTGNNKDWEEQLWAIRSAIQDTKATTVIVAGSQPSIVKEMIFGPKSPFLHSFKVMNIEPIERIYFLGHFKEVCKEYKVLEDKALINFVYKVCGGVPSYLSLFGRNLFDEVLRNKSKLETHTYYSALEKTIKDLSNTFNLLEQKIDDINYGMIVYKAIYDDKNPKDEVSKIANVSTQNIHSNSIKKLEEHGFVKKVKYGKYMPTDGMFGLYIAEHESAEKFKIMYEYEINKLLNKK